MLIRYLFLTAIELELLGTRSKKSVIVWLPDDIRPEDLVMPAGSLDPRGQVNE